VPVDVVEPSLNGSEFVEAASSQRIRLSSESMALPESSVWTFTEEMLAEMQADEDVSPSRDIDEQDLDLCPLAKPHQSFITVHPDPRYSLRWPVTYDFLKDGRKEDPYLVPRPFWKYFHPSLLSMKWVILCLRWENELLKPFLWAAPWREEGEPEQPLHKSVAFVMRHARQGWGQALWRGTHYQWLKWPSTRGEPPVILWPDRSFFSIVAETFEGRLVNDPLHPLIVAQGELVGETEP
jgi:hypothetical protein